ncbi:MAG: BglII/BstYI family type II restriction endonuclease [Alphaproteobacteria bacterium]
MAMLERLKGAGFDILLLQHAEAILLHYMPQAIEDIEQTLLPIKIPVVELVHGGGGATKLTQRLRAELSRRGWLKKRVEIKKLVNERPVVSLSHEIDHVKQFGSFFAALEIEWNNKDPFFDRDLESFRRLHAEGAISVGIVVTRGRSLQSQMGSLLSRFAETHRINSESDLQKYEYRPTRRSRGRYESGFRAARHSPRLGSKCS